MERLPVGCRRNLLFGCKHREKFFNFGLSHVARVVKASSGAGRPQHKRFGPVDISLLGL